MFLSTRVQTLRLVRDHSGETGPRKCTSTETDAHFLDLHFGNCPMLRIAQVENRGKGNFQRDGQVLRKNESPLQRQHLSLRWGVYLC